MNLGCMLRFVRVNNHFSDTLSVCAGFIPAANAHTKPGKPGQPSDGPFTDGFDFKRWGCVEAAAFPISVCFWNNSG
jgi:hypothetical protein